MKRLPSFLLAFGCAIALAAPAHAQTPPQSAQFHAPHPHPSASAIPRPAQPGTVPLGKTFAKESAKPEAAEPSEGAEAAGEEEHESGPKPINWIDFSNKKQPGWVFMFLNLLLLLGFYYKFFGPSLTNGLKTRRANISREIEEAQRMQKEAEARAAKYQQKLSHLEAELKETRDALQAAGEAERDRLIREAEEKAGRMERDAAFLVEQELKTMRADLTREAVETAVAAAEELLRKRITSSDQERLAEDYLAQLAARRPSGQERASLAPPAEGGE